ncbi:MAG: patatin-like phospholipase family protein [Chitinophagales bacterium]
MDTTKETKRLLYYSDFLIANFWRYLLQSLWLFFPPILFLLVAYFSFWHLPQGKDLIVISLQNAEYTPAIFPCFILGLIFWAYVTWYTTRIVARAHHFENPNHHNIATVFRVQSPRILAFTCITIIFLALFQLDNPAYRRWQISSFWCHILFLLSFSWYFIIWKFWTKYLERKNKKKTDWLRFLKKARRITIALLITSTIAVMIIRNFWGLVAYLVILQMGLVLSLILRREITEAKGETVNYFSPKRNDPGTTLLSPIWKKIRHIVTKDDDDRYFFMFNIIGLFAATVYVAAISSVKIANTIGSFPFVLLAFGVLLGIGNFITMISVFSRFNFHLVIFLVALLIGNFVDPHGAAVVKKENKLALFNQRQGLREYFLNWLVDTSRKAEIDSINPNGKRKYPVYFVLANGGASRSGYWTASVLANFEDSTREQFSRHLFCLSGASGGSVGTATFFSLLKAKKELKQQTDTTVTTATTAFLESDFLTYTLAHLLGPDIIRNIVPLNFVNDRASALAEAMEKASGENSFMYNRFAEPFSLFIPQKEQTNYHLPVICINTTRMQDSRPGVISNINIAEDAAIFNNRVDVLSLLTESEDLKLSTAVVLGASFPYISPAGRINSLSTDSGAHYFVDGAYFDNSGAGVVNEMIIAMNTMLNNSNDTAFDRFRGKLEFHVIHISNTEPKNLKFVKINPIANDLLAPLRTLLGSYGTQTTINDQRLRNFLSGLYGNDTHYTNIDLYRDNLNIKYSMNWVIPRSQLDSMTSNLKRNIDVHKAYASMDSLFFNRR